MQLLTKSILVALLAAGGLSACRPGGKDKTIYFTRKDFPETKSLSGEEVPLGLPGGRPLQYNIVRDSLAMVTYWESDTYFVDVVNFRNGRLVRQIARRGEDSAAFVSCAIRYPNPADNYFTIHDITKQRVSKFNIDSMLAGSDYQGIHYNLPSFVKAPALYGNDTLVLFNSYFLKPGKSPMNPGSKTPVLFLPVANASEEGCMRIDSLMKPTFFTSNVSGGEILINPDRDLMWVVDNYRDQIVIYRHKDKVVKRLTGPDNIRPEYEQHSDSSVYFKDAEYYRAYYPGACTDRHVYLLYLGVQGINLNATRVERPVAILQFDWDGNLVRQYNVKEYLYNISISPDEKFLYGTTVSKFGAPAKLMRYALP
ncbi:BF3164 family lipoprotein [Chitinophaga sp. NPDC101104]|uniref:BF3164 family lipoprotein n=1 Tax=Chitinophaga sp. NPDC101104 TaxID=3390561 RepID=UPI003D030E83